MLLAVRDGARWSLDRAGRVRRAYARVAEEIDVLLPSGVSTKFVDVLFHNAYVTIGDVVTACGVTRQTASGWLRRLAEAGVLDELVLGKHKAFLNRLFHYALLGD